MKNIKFLIAGLSLLSFTGVLVSCDQEEDKYPAIAQRPIATLTSSNNAIPEFDDASTATVLENRITYTITVDKPSKLDLSFKVTYDKAASTATADDAIVNLKESGIDNGSDGFLVIISANTLSKTFTIDANEDVLPETSEVIRYTLMPAVELGAVVAEASKSFGFTISNSTSQDLVVSFDWSSVYLDAAGGVHDAADYDFDLEIYDAAGAVIVDDYDGSPAVVTFPSTQPNGTYDIAPTFWTNLGVSAPSLPINFKTTITVSKPGIYSKSFVYNDKWNSAVGGVVQGNPNGTQSPLYFIKTGNVYQVFERATNTILVSGKVGNVGKTFTSKRKK